MSLSKKYPMSKIYKRDSGICWICRLPVPKETNVELLKPTRDHFHPKTFNKFHREENPKWNNRIKLAHRFCNRTRGCQTIFSDFFDEDNLNKLKEKILELLLTYHW